MPKKENVVPITDIRGKPEPTVYIGMRLKKSFYERLLRVAELQKNSVRGVVEQMETTTLPELEQWADATEEMVKIRSQKIAEAKAKSKKQTG